MRTAYIAFLLCLILVICLANTLCLAQSEERKPWEAGFHFTGLHLNVLGEGAAGIGGRTSYEFTKRGLIFAPETEFNYFPENPGGNFGESQLLVGGRIGLRVDRVGVFFKARPGFVHFGGNDFRVRNNGPSTNFATDIGVALEYINEHGIGIRFDFGDTMIRFPDPVFTGGSLIPNPPSLAHNLQGGVGVVFRF